MQTGRLIDVADADYCFLMLLRTYQLSLHSGETPNYGPRPLNSTRRHGLFLNLTCDISLSDMRHGGKYSDMKHGYFVNSTCDMVEDKRPRHATLPFHKSTCEIGDPPSKAPKLNLCAHYLSLLMI